MITKCRIASKVASEGIRVYIANGKRPDILTDLLAKPAQTPHTEFLPNPGAISSVKKWIAHSAGFSKGTIHINHKASEALLSNSKAASLLLVGATAIDGDFEEGDIVSIVDENQTEIALGRSGYDADEARQLLGQHDQKPLVHYDYLFLLKDGMGK